jgi:NAD(P)-dependent dehydrogenase (short-subunit alcohol dehydrogenase family)
MRVKGKVALVTGAGQGIGEAIAVNLAKEGAHVAVADINIDNVNKVAEKIKALRRNTIAIKTDVTSYKEVEQMVKLTVEKLGEIDILVNNAGGQVAGVQPKLVCEQSEADWDAMIALNLKSVFNCCRNVLSHMIERQSGKIVNIASVGGMVGIAGSTVYATAKAGVIGFTKSLAKEVAEYGINVNSVSPGPIATPLFMEITSDVKKEQYKQWTGFNRFGIPEDIAYTVTFLASDEANLITGQNHAVCGLRDLGGPDKR